MTARALSQDEVAMLRRYAPYGGDRPRCEPKLLANATHAEVAAFDALVHDGLIEQRAGGVYRTAAAGLALLAEFGIHPWMPTDEEPF